MIHIVIKTPLGMGDQLICSGAVKRFVKNTKHEKIDIVTRAYQYRNTKQLYEDCSNVRVVGVTPWDEYDRGWKEPFKKLDTHPRFLYFGEDGHHQKYRQGQKFDVRFYKSMGLDIEEKWKNFSLKRNRENEQVCYDKFVTGDYIFVHDESSLGVHELNIDSKLPIIRPDRKYCIFDWLKIIENAKQIHCVDSSFLNMIDLLQIKGDKYYHDAKDKYIKDNKLQMWIDVLQDENGECSPTIRDDWQRVRY